VTTHHAPELTSADAERYAGRFAGLADPTRIQLLHRVVTAGRATVTELAEQLLISEPVCGQHLDRLADAGLVDRHQDGGRALVSAGPAARIGLLQAVDAVTASAPASRPFGPDGLPPDVTVRALRDDDWDAVRRIYAEGISTGNATFETRTPSRRRLESAWLPEHRWVAEVDGAVGGWTAVTPVSARECYAGVGETSIYVGAGQRGRGHGRALLHRQVTAADAGGLWTLQTSIFPENESSIGLHLAAGYRILARRERIGRHHGVWRDTVLMERRSPTADSVIT
jgi:L-amino acid N-acyltransferase YncA